MRCVMRQPDVLDNISPTGQSTDIYLYRYISAALGCKVPNLKVQVNHSDGLGRSYVRCLTHDDHSLITDDTLL